VFLAVAVTYGLCAASWFLLDCTISLVNDDDPPCEPNSRVLTTDNADERG
jgi:hypothetical protein